MPNGLHSRNNETLCKYILRHILTPAAFITSVVVHIPCVPSVCHALMNTIVSVGGHQGKLTECSCYYTGEEDACCDECKQMILLSRMPQPKK